MRGHFNPIMTSLGIILSRRKHLENNFRLHLFLRDQGKVISTLKSSHAVGSKLKTLQEPFVLADFQIFLAPDSVSARVIGGKLIRSHPQIRQNLEAFSAASQFCETIELLFPFRAPAPDIFDVLSLSLASLQNRFPPKQTKLWFLFQLLKKLGHGDLTDDLLSLLPMPHRNGLKTLLAECETPDADKNVDLEPVFCERALLFLERQLEAHLPKELKSGLFEKSLLTQTRELDNLMQTSKL